MPIAESFLAFSTKPRSRNHGIGRRRRRRRRREEACIMAMDLKYAKQEKECTVRSTHINVRN
jgi:hypothetical protein